jgi:hypothetical protein
MDGGFVDRMRHHIACPEKHFERSHYDARSNRPLNTLISEQKMQKSSTGVASTG